MSRTTTENSRERLTVSRLSSQSGRPSRSGFFTQPSNRAQDAANSRPSARMPRKPIDDLIEHEVDPAEVSQMALMTRSSVEAMLVTASAGGNVEISPRELSEAARRFPDIAQCDPESLPSVATSDLRKSHHPLSSRYVFVPSLVSDNADGVYHVQVMHGGATITVSRVSRYLGRLIHDPYSLQPREYDGASLAFLKTCSFLNDPIGSVHIRNAPDTVELRGQLVQAFVHVTKEDPFGEKFTSAALVHKVSENEVKRPENTVRKVPRPA